MKAWLRTLRSEPEGYAIALGVLAFHLLHAPAVAHGAVFAKDNLAFDFDIGRFASLWAAAPYEIAQNAPYYAVRHPLAILPRLLSLPLAAAGIEPRVVACGFAACCAALAVGLAFRIARTVGADRTTASALTMLWSVSTTPLLLGVLPEAYGLALAALSWQMLVAARWARGDTPSTVVRIAAGVVNLGITVTNVVLAGLVEIVLRLARQPWRKAVPATAVFSAAITAIGIALAVLSFRIWPVDQIAASGGAAKQLYWSASFAEGDTGRQSPAEVVWTFAGISAVAPAIAAYPSGAADDPYLYDLRGRGYDAVGWLAVAGWLGLLLFGTVAATRDRMLRPLWIVAGGWFLFNAALHSHWHFRRTVFLYAAHPHVALFVLVAAGARWVAPRGPAWRTGYAAAVTLVAALTFANNLPLYLALPRLR